jgi:hypothetical protein
MKREKESHGDCNERLEKLVSAAMHAIGWLLPQSVDEVRAIEEAMEADPPTIPQWLADPYELLKSNRRGEGADHRLGDVRDPGIEENLSRAARDGKQISPEVAEKMRKDREVAEGKASE